MKTANLNEPKLILDFGIGVFKKMFEIICGIRIPLNFILLHGNEER